MRAWKRWPRRLAAAIGIGLLLTAIPLASVKAGSPEPVEIFSTMYVHAPANTGTFSRTSGSDLICSSGTVLDTRYVWGQPHGRGGGPNGVQLQVDKTFDCGNGLVYFRLQVHGVFATETFTWVVLGGTGPYAGLRGQGSGWTDGSDFGTCTCVDNYYSGQLIG